MNLFGFIRNRPIGKIDLLGLVMPSFFEPSPQPEQSMKERLKDLKQAFLEKVSGEKPAPGCVFMCTCVFTFDFVKRDKEAWDKFLQDQMLDFDKNYNNPRRGRDFKPGNTEPGMSNWDAPTSPDDNEERVNKARRKYQKEVEEYINFLTENWDDRYSALQGISRDGIGQSTHENIARWKAMEKLKEQLRAVYEERGGKTLQDSDIEVLRTDRKPATPLNFAKCKCLKFIDGDGKEPHYPEVDF